MGGTACIGCGRAAEGARCAFCAVAFAPGGFVVERVLAQGPHGRVYCARAPDGSAVALKELQFANVPGAEQIDAFEREAKTLAALSDRAIPRFVASFQEGSGVQLRLYLASEFIEGEPFSARISRGPLPELELRDVARQVLRVLAYLHGQPSPVIHRDIKPDNLIVRPDGTVVLVDFGSARRLRGTTTYSATLAGTFGYMPTEQLGGTVDASSDLYALGATLLHAATGKPPADLLEPDFSLRVPPSVPASLRPLLTALLQPRRDRRLRNADRALAVLDQGGARPVRLRVAMPAAGALALAIASLVLRTPAAPSRISTAAAAQRTPGAGGWLARAKPYCNPVEVARFMARNPPEPGWQGAGAAAGCWALAGRIAEARALIDRLPGEDRWRAAGVVFDLAHPVADSGDDVAAAPIMNLVLESWPNHFQAMYHAGMSDYALGHHERARVHLTKFLELYKEDDGFRRNAQDVLRKLGE